MDLIYRVKRTIDFVVEFNDNKYHCVADIDVFWKEDESFNHLNTVWEFDGFYMNEVEVVDENHDCDQMVILEKKHYHSYYDETKNFWDAIEAKANDVAHNTDCPSYDEFLGVNIND